MNGLDRAMIHYPLLDKNNVIPSQTYRNADGSVVGYVLQMTQNKFQIVGFWYDEKTDGYTIPSSVSDSFKTRRKIEKAIEDLEEFLNSPPDFSLFA